MTTKLIKGILVVSSHKQTFPYSYDNIREAPCQELICKPLSLWQIRSRTLTQVALPPPGFWQLTFFYFHFSFFPLFCIFTVPLAFFLSSEAPSLPTLLQNIFEFLFCKFHGWGGGDWLKVKVT